MKEDPGTDFFLKEFMPSCFSFRVLRVLQVRYITCVRMIVNHFPARQTLSSDELKLNSIILLQSTWTRLPRSFFSLHLFYFYHVTRPYNGPLPLELAFKCRILVAVLFKKTFRDSWRECEHGFSWRICELQGNARTR